MTIQSLLELLESGDAFDSNEAAKALIKRKLTKIEIHRLASIAKGGKELHNQADATYALSWMFLNNNKSGLPFLIEHLNNKTLHPEVRAQCAEGLAYTEPDKRNKYRKYAEKALMTNLKDSSPQVRFWCCFAVGQWKLKKAITILRHIKNHDSSICPKWWYVSEEAEDAIDNILGRETGQRLPVAQRNEIPQKNRAWLRDIENALAIAILRASRDNIEQAYISEYAAEITCERRGVQDKNKDLKSKSITGTRILHNSHHNIKPDKFHIHTFINSYIASHIEADLLHESKGEMIIQYVSEKMNLLRCRVAIPIL